MLPPSPPAPAIPRPQPGLPGRSGLSLSQVAALQRLERLRAEQSGNADLDADSLALGDKVGAVKNVFDKRAAFPWKSLGGSGYRVGMGALMGGLAGGDLAGPSAGTVGVGGYQVNPLGAIAGGILHSPRVGASRFGQAGQRALAGSFGGSIVGGLGDSLAGPFTGSTGNSMARAGAWAGLLGGLGASRSAPPSGTMVPMSLAGAGHPPPSRLGRMAQGIDELGAGAMEGAFGPMRAMGRGALNLTGHAMGYNTTNAPAWLNAWKAKLTPSVAGRTPLGDAGRAIGNVGAAIPLAAGAVGIGQQALGRELGRQTGDLYAHYLPMLYNDMTAMLQHKGLLDDYGRVKYPNPLRAFEPWADKMLARVGADPEHMSGAGKAFGAPQAAALVGLQYLLQLLHDAGGQLQHGYATRVRPWWNSMKAPA